MPQQDWLEKDFYKTLNVSEDVSDAELTKAYRKLARKYHPDANPGDQKAEDRFKKISEAYDVLGDETRRKEYDELRRLGPMGGLGGFGSDGSSRSGGQQGYDFSGQDFSGQDWSDILGGLFNNQSQTRASSAKKGEDLEASLSLSFNDSITGVTTSVHLTSDVACTTCHGSGAKPGTTPSVCQACKGRGVSDLNQGLFSFSQPCSACNGRGRVVVDPCPTCQASGIQRKPRQVKVRIPAGVRDGQRIRLKGRGTPGRNGGPTGDLFVKVKVMSDETFGRSGKNLTIDVPVTFAEAALGAKVRVPTMQGDRVTLKIPEGTPSGKTFRVRGKGVASGGSTGDLLVTVVVDIPTHLNPQQKAAVEAFAKASSVSPREHLDTKFS